MAVKNVVVINLLRLGDILQSIPLILELKRNNCTVTLICQNIDIDFLKEENFVDEIIKIDIYKLLAIIKNKDLLRNYDFLDKSFSFLPYKSFDQVFNLNSLTLSYQIALFVVKEKQNIFGATFDKNDLIKLDPVFEYLYSISSERKNSLINLAELYLSYAHRSISFEIFQRENQFNKKKQIIITISTGEEIREFTTSFYINLINSLSGKNYKIILTGTNSAKGEEIYKNIKSKNVENLVNKTTLKELFNLYKISDMLISPDTGTIHLAALTSIKILGLYNISAFHHLTGAYSSLSYFLTPKINCYPCEEAFQPCGNLKCKEFFKFNDVIYAIEYILGNISTLDFENLNFWKYEINEYGGFQQIISGEDISYEQQNILSVIKFLLFQVNFKQIKPISAYWDEFKKIYDIAVKNNYFYDLYRFVKENGRYDYFLPFMNDL